MMFEYQVVTAGEIEELEAKVNEALSHYWICRGGVAVYRYEYEDSKGYTIEGVVYHQAMTRKGVRIPEFKSKWK